MRDLGFFNTKAEYEDYLWNDVFVEDWVRETPFYRNLVNFIIDHRSPIFYTISDPSEHFAFSGAYHFETRRERYPNKTREILFWLHDFTHMLFPYAHDVYEVSEKEFFEQFWYQERLASSETEIMAYYRVPGLRERVFPDEKLWYDVIRERGWYNNLSAQTGRREYLYSGDSIPDATKFLDYRIRVQMEDAFGQRELGDHPEILKFITQWRRLTPKWVSQRYRSVAGIRVPDSGRWDRNFTAENYERRILSYHSAKGTEADWYQEEQYRQNVMANVRTAFALLGWEDSPTRWRHVPEAFDQLEGAVFFK